MNQRDFSMRVLACEQRLYRISMAILKNTADCEDAVQEALLRAWNRLDNLREECYFETWLIRILINECRAALRKRRADVPLTETLSSPEPPDPRLRDALFSIDVKYRLPIVLHYVEEYSVAETAMILHITRGAAKWRIERGKRQIEQALRQEKEE